jgi:hypothetical protein
VIPTIPVPNRVETNFQSLFSSAFAHWLTGASNWPVVQGELACLDSSAHDEKTERLSRRFLPSLRSLR